MAPAVLFESRLEYAGAEKYIYTYTIWNRTATPVGIAWGVVLDPSKIDKKWHEEKWLALTDKKAAYLSLRPVLPNARAVAQVTTWAAPKWGVGTALVFDEQGRFVAAGTATSYGPSSGSIADLTISAATQAN